MASLVKTDKISTTAGGAQEFTLPAADGTANQHLKTDGSGVLGWATPPTGIALTGSTNTWIPTITGADALTGTANFTYDGNILDVKNSGTASSIKLYCESSNAHYQAIKAAPHSGSSDWTLTLPPTAPTANGQALTATTAGVASWATAGGGLNSVQVFTSSGTWTRPSGVTKVIMEVQGAGGSGSYNTAENNNHGGGGGGYARKFLDVSSISTSTITIGAGGAATTSQGAGTAGGLSSWADGTNTITGNGGTGGGTTADNANVGGTGVGGDINIQGGATAGNYAYGDQGGSTPLGFGGHAAVGPAGVIFHQTPTGYGAGSGLFNSSQGTTTYDDSPQGGAGIIIVWEFK